MKTISFPVIIQTKVLQQQGMTIYYPKVSGLNNLLVEHNINQTIYNGVQTLIREQYRQQNTDDFTEMIGTYEVKTNERGILSLSLSNYAIFYQAAHGLTLMQSLTFDLMTGKSYTLNELFRPNSDYVDVLSTLIKKQIDERNIPLLHPFTSIRSDQDFYIADKSLVVYFQLYEITAYYIGFPMFPISVFELEDIVLEDGPLGVMMTNS